MKVFDTLASISDDPSQEGYVLRFDTIEHEGHWWLVPEWLESRTTKQRTPALLVRPVQGLRRDSPTTFVSPEPIPKAVLDGLQAPGWILVLHAAQNLPPAGTVQ